MFVFSTYIHGIIFVASGSYIVLQCQSTLPMHNCNYKALTFWLLPYADHTI